MTSDVIEPVSNGYVLRIVEPRDVADKRMASGTVEFPMTSPHRRVTMAVRPSPSQEEVRPDDGQCEVAQGASIP